MNKAFLYSRILSAFCRGWWRSFYLLASVLRWDLGSPALGDRRADSLFLHSATSASYPRFPYSSARDCTSPPSPTYTSSSPSLRTTLSLRLELPCDDGNLAFGSISIENGVDSEGEREDLFASNNEVDEGDDRRR